MTCERRVQKPEDAAEARSQVNMSR